MERGPFPENGGKIKIGLNRNLIHPPPPFPGTAPPKPFRAFVGGRAGRRYHGENQIFALSQQLRQPAQVESHRVPSKVTLRAGLRQGPPVSADSDDPATVVRGLPRDDYSCKTPCPKAAVT